MNKTARNKPAVLKISRRSATRIGPVPVQGPFSRAKKPLSLAQTSRGHLRKASGSESSSQTSRTFVLGKIQGAPSKQASTSPKPVQSLGPKTSVPASSDRLSTNRDQFRTQKPFLLRGPAPKSKIPVPSGYGNQGSASGKPGSAFSDETFTSPGSVQKEKLKAIENETPEPFIRRPRLLQNDEPGLSDQASSSPRSEQISRYPKNVNISSDQLSTSPLESRVPVPKTKIPILSESRIRNSTSTSPSPVPSPLIKASKPIITGRAFGSTYSLQTQGEKASEPLSSVGRNRTSASNYSGLVQKQGNALSTRTPTSPGILQNGRPRPKAGESVVRNRGSVSSSPSYIRRPKPSVPVHQDRASAGPKLLQARGPKAKKPVSTVQECKSKSKSAFKGPATLQTKGPLPKSNKLASPVPKNRVGSVPESPRHVSWKRAPASPVPAKTPGPKRNESVASANKNQNFASRRPGTLGTNKSRIPTGGQTSSSLPELHAKIHTKPDFPSKQILKKSPSTSPDRKSQLATRTNLGLQTKLADELDRRNRSINELEIKLVQNQNLVSEQALRLAESKAVQRAKDVALEQLKSELTTAKDEYDRMHSRLREADLGLEQATCKVKKFLERSSSMEDEIKEAREKIVNLQRQLKDANTKAEIHCQTKDQLRQDVERMQEQLTLDSKRIQSLQQSETDLRRDLEHRDMQITQINHQLADRDEEFRNLFETLKNKHTQLRSQERNIKRLEERYERGSLNRSKLEERNATLLDKIERLKNDLRYYSQMVIANDGKPFFEAVPPGINPDISDELVPSPEEVQRKSRRREK